MGQVKAREGPTAMRGFKMRREDVWVFCLLLLAAIVVAARTPRARIDALTP